MSNIGTPHGILIGEAREVWKGETSWNAWWFS